MDSEYRTPGVYAEEIPKLPLSVSAVETSVVAFIGYTEIASDTDGSKLLLKPVKIRSMLEFEQKFGNAPGENAIVVSIHDTVGNKIVTSRIIKAEIDPVGKSRFLTWYAVKLFFDNGGVECVIISCGIYGRRSIRAANADSDIDIRKLKSGLNAARLVDNITILIFPDATALSSESYSILIHDSLNQCFDLKDRIIILDLKEGQQIPFTIDEAISGFRSLVQADIGSATLSYGAAYFPSLVTNLNYAYSSDLVNISYQSAGDGDLNAKFRFSDMQNPGRRIPVAVQENLGMRKSTSIPGRYESIVNQVLCDQVTSSINQLRVSVLPSGPVAGIICSVDRTRGVWKAPANVSLNNVTGTSIPITADDQLKMSVDETGGLSINPIRVFPGKGVLVWGARTLAGNNNEWRYISVRRLFNFVEESIRNSTRWVVFEPNDANTWVKVRTMVENFLYILWRDGALMGSRTQDAFYVHTGLGSTMTQQDILDGKLIIETGLAVVRPAEFIITRITHKKLMGV